MPVEKTSRNNVDKRFVLTANFHMCCLLALGLWAWTVSLPSRCWKVNTPSKINNYNWCQNALKKPTDELHTLLCTEVFIDLISPSCFGIVLKKPSNAPLCHCFLCWWRTNRAQNSHSIMLFLGKIYYDLEQKYLCKYCFLFLMAFYNRWL